MVVAWGRDSVASKNCTPNIAPGVPWPRAASAAPPSPGGSATPSPDSAPLRGKRPFRTTLHVSCLQRPCLLNRRKHQNLGTCSQNWTWVVLKGNQKETVAISPGIEITSALPPPSRDCPPCVGGASSSGGSSPPGPEKLTSEHVSSGLGFDQGLF